MKSITVLLTLAALFSAPVFAADKNTDIQPPAAIGANSPAGATAVTASGEGTLIANCDPSGASVYLDGELLGEAPVKKPSIRGGEHILTFRKPGYEDSTGKITIKDGVTLTVEDKMAEARGELRLTTEPPGVKVSVDGRDAGTTPAVIKRLSSGEHAVSLSLEYFEGRTFTETFTAGEQKDLSLSLKRHVLLIKTIKGSGSEAAFERLAGWLAEKLPGISVSVSEVVELCKTLSSQGLDPSSIGFVESRKICLDLEDSSVLSNLLEQGDAELAFLVGLDLSGREKTLRLGFYSSVAAVPDNFSFSARDFEGLMAKFDGFLDGWAAQEKVTRATVGAVFVDRLGGGAGVVRVLPGFPAAEAGLIPGDVITAVDGTAVAGKAALIAALSAEREHRVSYTEHGERLSASLRTVMGPVETPAASGRFLYNLALVEYGTGEGGDDEGPTGYAALNEGNVQAHLGEYQEAVKLYKRADTHTASGVCTGTALYRLGQAYEATEMWTEAAGAYRKALLLYPDATMDDADGPLVGPAAKSRLKEIYTLGLVREKWWI